MVIMPLEFSIWIWLVLAIFLLFLSFGFLLLPEIKWSNGIHFRTKMLKFIRHTCGRICLRCGLLTICRHNTERVRDTLLYWLVSTIWMHFYFFRLNISSATAAVAQSTNRQDLNTKLNLKFDPIKTIYT